MRLCKFIIILLLIGNSLCFSINNITWKKLRDKTDLLFMGIDNCDSLYAMAVAPITIPGEFDSWGAILKTTDGGLTWKYALYDTVGSTEPFFVVPWDISYPTRDFCIIGCDSNHFVRTTDGGITWHEYIVDLPYTTNGFNDVDMYDENNGVMKNRNYIVISHDGFNTWDTIRNPGDNVIFNVEMTRPNSIKVLSGGSNGPSNVRFFSSDDGGKTWNEYPHPYHSIPRNLHFIDSLTGYEVGGNRIGIGDQRSMLIFKTTDGGRTWDNVLDTIISVSFALQSIDFYDKENGIAVGQFGSIFWTHDGGKSWVFDSSTEMSEIYAPTLHVSYIQKNRAIIADYLGRIFISEDTTTDVVEEIQNDDDFTLFPNPAADKIKIRFKDEFINSTEIQIFNSYGQEIINKSSSDFGLQTSGFRLLELDISSLLSGVYFAVINENGKVITKPFVVLK